MKGKLNYFCKNELNGRIVETRSRRKKAVTTYYSDTSLAMAPTSDERQFCSKNATTHGATNFTLSTWGSYKLGGDSVVYTSKSDGSAFCHCLAGERPLGFSSQTSMDSEEAWFLDERKRNLL